MILGFTGTRKGCTPAQLTALRTFLGLYQPGTLLHGGAVGADAEVHYLAIENGWRIGVLLQSGVLPQSTFIRNGIIARRCERLIACPADAAGSAAGGTWMTVRRARKLGRPVTLILPDGSIKEEHPV